jgi:hypothetical protein
MTKLRHQVCPTCHRLNHDAQFCDQCGRELPTEAAPESLRIAVVLIRLIAIIYALLVGVSYLRDPEAAGVVAVLRDVIIVFFAWVHADLIRVVLQIRDRV